MSLHLKVGEHVGFLFWVTIGTVSILWNFLWHNVISSANHIRRLCLLQATRTWHRSESRVGSIDRCRAADFTVLLSKAIAFMKEMPLRKPILDNIMTFSRSDTNLTDLSHYQTSSRPKSLSSTIGNEVCHESERPCNEIYLSFRRRSHRQTQISKVPDWYVFICRDSASVKASKEPKLTVKLQRHLTKFRRIFPELSHETLFTGV